MRRPLQCRVGRWVRGAGCAARGGHGGGDGDGGHRGGQGDGFDHDGRHYDLSCGVINPELVEPTPFATGAGYRGAKESLHRIRGVDPAILVAVPNDGLCNLAPGQAWQSAFSVEELRAGRPSAAYNEAWCTASLNGPDPAEGFSC